MSSLLVTDTRFGRRGRGTLRRYLVHKHKRTISMPACAHMRTTRVQGHMQVRTRARTYTALTRVQGHCAHIRKLHP